MTIVLTTHNMEEAEYLCDRIAIMDHGRIVAEGSPQDLILEHAPEPPAARLHAWQSVAPPPHAESQQTASTQNPLGHSEPLVQVPVSRTMRPRTRELPYPDECFDAAFAVHVVYFWSDPVPELREILRTLRPGGRLLLGYRPRDAQALASLPASVYALRAAGEIEAALAEAGFAEPRSIEHGIGGVRFVLSQGLRR